MRSAWCLYSSGFHSSSICCVCCVPGTILIIEGAARNKSCGIHSLKDMHVGIVGTHVLGQIGLVFTRILYKSGSWLAHNKMQDTILCEAYNHSHFCYLVEELVNNLYIHCMYIVMNLSALFKGPVPGTLQKYCSFLKKILQFSREDNMWRRKAGSQHLFCAMYLAL